MGNKIKILSFNENTVYDLIVESLDDIYATIDTDDRGVIDELTSKQDELINQYDLSNDEIANIKDKLEDTIRMKYR